MFLQVLHDRIMSGADGNKPCWCGSGKKQKKCHTGPTKPRETRIV